MHLALVGAYEWAGLPSLPPWLMMLPERGPVSIYDLSSWARGSTVPLILLFDRKPVYGPPLHLDELYAEGRANAVFALPAAKDGWERFFNGCDALLKWTEKANVVPFRARGLARAERWTVERQEATGDWGGIIPAMLNAMLALRAIGYDLHDPVVERGWAAIDGFTIGDGGPLRVDDDTEAYRVQPCISPVWDTGLAVRALIDAGVRRDDPRLQLAVTWLLDKQIVARYGDWSVKNRSGKPGGWAFEFENAYYPDVDDTAVVAMAIAAVDHPEPDRVRGALSARRAVGRDDAMPRRRLGCVRRRQRQGVAQPRRLQRSQSVDRSADRRRHRARARDGRARHAIPFDARRYERGLAFLLAEQERDGAWFGRWGVNYVYGTSGALAALGPARAGAAPSTQRASAAPSG